jgi:hypothetical protein
VEKTMSNIKFTAALSVIGMLDKHVTLVFCDPKHTAKIYPVSTMGLCNIVGVEYWENVNKTVLIIDSDFVMQRHLKYIDAGFSYDDYDFRPHIAWCKGDKVQFTKYLINDSLLLGDESFRFLDVDYLSKGKKV